MAYADAASLMSTIDRLLISSHFSIAPSDDILINLFSQTMSLQRELGRLGDMFGYRRNDAMNTFLDGQARERIRKLEDSLESFISNQIILSQSVQEISLALSEQLWQEIHPITGQISLSQSDHEGSPLILSVDSKQEVHPFTGRVKEIEDYLHELKSNPLPDEEEEEEEEEEALESHISNCVGSSWILYLGSGQVWQEIHHFIGWMNLMEKELQDYTKQVWQELPEDEEEVDDDDDDAVSSRIGRTGGIKSNMIGFSNEFHKIKCMVLEYASYGRLSISLFGMVGIGKTTLAKEVFEHPSILSQFDSRVWVTVGPNCTWKRIIRSILAQVDPVNGHKMIMKLGVTKLEGYLNKRLKEKRHLIVLDDVWRVAFCYNLQDRLPGSNNRSCVLVTTRLRKVAQMCDVPYEIELMDEETSWDLLREKVFGEERCPPQLEKAGKKIAKECEGLPLLIVEVAKLLCEAEKSPEYWSKVAEKNNSVFMDAHDQISHVVFPSYLHLQHVFKTLLVYMGVFPHKYEIPCSKLINLWCAEGFHTINKDDVECFDALIAESVIMGRVGIYGKKTCRLHSVFWHLCNKEAGKNNFFHVLSRRADSFIEGIRSQRRLCIHNNVLLSIKDANDSMASALATRSLLCTGPYHQYQVPVCFSLRLLKVLYALSIRFYEFPMEVVKLVLLRYFALTYDGQIPPSISKLWNLEYFIVHRHFSIKSSRGPSFLPMEIWEMNELKHLEIMGYDLRDPCGAFLPTLLTLSDVSAQSCTKSVFKSLPELKKLRIRIELELDAIQPLSCFDYISFLRRLQSLKCVIVNPNLKPLQACIANFSSGLKRLRLSGFGYPWEHMKVIASLPNLEVLKLRSYAFRGPKWEMRSMLQKSMDASRETAQHLAPKRGLGGSLARSGLSVKIGKTFKCRLVPRRRFLQHWMRVKGYLKLTYQGLRWEMRDKRLLRLLSLPTEENDEYDYRFLRLKYLLIEDTDLVQWRITRASFPSLQRLSLKHCYKLRQIPLEFADLSSLGMIEVVDCSPLAVTWAKQVAEAKEKQGNSNFNVSLHSSWDD